MGNGDTDEPKDEPKDERMRRDAPNRHARRIVRDEATRGGMVAQPRAFDDPRPASRAERQERALALLCQGLRPTAIAAAIGTTPGTVRRWLRTRFAGIAREAREEHAQALLRAIEAQREVARAAWEAYQHERAVEAAVLRGELDRLKRRAVRRQGTAPGRARGRTRDGDADPVDDDESREAESREEVVLEEYERPRLPSQGARYLALALTAQREMARLQGLYDEIAQQPDQFSITITRRPAGPENLPPEECAALLAAEDEADDENGEDTLEGEGEP
jgi:transposase